ncbi:MAG: UDP-N-acetylmuramoyl-tripeptide--D-alanyl-D-alanine ligase [Oscillospiraceae bacterium]|nr:UDP-N-acetylmuramoyl-tripeptide--D-alanyl-D-alanine ligase [Oscillospiraceae bacterium]
MNMKALTLADIARACKGNYIGAAELQDSCITGVVRDNRQIRPGNLFVCFKGERVDGHSFVPAAFEAGAACCLVEHEPEAPGGPCILVDSVGEALKSIAKYYRSLFDIPFIGVTGSVGKTSAKEMVASVLSTKYKVLKTPENLNNEIGVPLTLLSVPEDCEMAVVEMGISDFGEMSRLADMVRPDVCLMTNIGYCHLETLGDLDGVLRAKGEVCDFMDMDATLVVNGDDSRLRAFEPGIKKLCYGFGEDNDFHARNICSEGFNGISCDICWSGGSFPVFIPAFGQHLVYAALAAAAVAKHFGLGDEDIARGLADYRPVGGRANVSDTGYITVIDDCYNANPNSVSASVESLSAVKGRRVAILGDMMELGKNEKELHRGIGVLCAEKGIDSVICCGRLAEFIYKGFISTGRSSGAWQFPMKEALFSVLPSLIRKGDTVLVKASHSMQFEEIVEELKKLR